MNLGEEKYFVYNVHTESFDYVYEDITSNQNNIFFSFEYNCILKQQYAKEFNELVIEIFSL